MDERSGADLVRARLVLTAEEVSRLEPLGAPAVWVATVRDRERKIGRLFLEREEFKAERDELRAALLKLTNEAEGFIGMASRKTHGNTNINILLLRITEAREALKTEAKEKP